MLKAVEKMLTYTHTHTHMDTHTHTLHIHTHTYITVTHTHTHARGARIPSHIVIFVYFCSLPVLVYII